MPFAGFKDFDACVKANADKADPEAYCATIQRKVEKIVKHAVHDQKDHGNWARDMRQPTSNYWGTYRRLDLLPPITKSQPTMSDVHASGPVLARRKKKKKDKRKAEQVAALKTTRKYPKPRIGGRKKKKVRGALAKHDAPIHPGTGTDQSVHSPGGGVTHHGTRPLAPARGSRTKAGEKYAVYVGWDGEPMQDPSADPAVAPPLTTANLPDKVNEKLFAKIATYDITVEEMAGHLDSLAEDALALYEDMADGKWRTGLPEWLYRVDANGELAVNPDYAHIAEDMVEFDGERWRWRDGAAEVLKHDDRFYQLWHEDLFETAELTGGDDVPNHFSRVVGLAAAISPNQNATSNLAYAHEIANLVAADPVFSAEAAELANAKLEAHGFGTPIEEGMRLSELSDGQVMARAAGTLRILEEFRDGQYYYPGTDVLIEFNPGNQANYGVGRTWDNFAKGFDIITGRVSVNDALGGGKVRSFHNNIIDPDNLSGRDDVTIDFQTIDAAFNRTGSGGITELSSGGKYFGADYGSKGLVADLIRRTGQQSGIGHGSDTQQIIWGQWKRTIWNRPEYSLSGNGVGGERTFFAGESVWKNPDAPRKKRKPKSVPDWVVENRTSGTTEPATMEEWQSLLT